MPVPIVAKLTLKKRGITTEEFLKPIFPDTFALIAKGVFLLGLYPSPLNRNVLI